MLSESETSPAGEVVEAGLVPRLVDFLRSRGQYSLETPPQQDPQYMCSLA